MSEAEYPLEHYTTIEDVFTRRLKPGIRQVSGLLASPADGYCLNAEKTTEANIGIQAKGISYSLTELLYGVAPAAPEFDLGFFGTIYLAPHNYHRVHAPVSGVVRKLRYIPGQLWPVNTAGVQLVPRLFVRNERIIFEIEALGGTAYVAMVGALNVGRIAISHYPQLVSNSLKRQLLPAKPVEIPCRFAVNNGEEIGTFMLGSTVIVVLDVQSSKNLAFRSFLPYAPILMGESMAEKLNSESAT